MTTVAYTAHLKMRESFKKIRIHDKATARLSLAMHLPFLAFPPALLSLYLSPLQTSRKFMPAGALTSVALRDEGISTLRVPARVLVAPDTERAQHLHTSHLSVRLLSGKLFKKKVRTPLINAAIRRDFRACVASPQARGAFTFLGFNEGTRRHGERSALSREFH